MPGSTIDRLELGLAAGLVAAGTVLAAGPAAADFDRVR
jgi:hypothetical protein